MDRIERRNIGLDIETPLLLTQHRQKKTTDKSTNKWRKQMPKGAIPWRIDRPFTEFSIKLIMYRVSVAIVSISLSLTGFLLPLEASAQSVFSQRSLPQVTFGSRTLRFGLAGTDVVELQQRLQQLGYNVPSSGIFDDSTEAAVIAFQFDRGLTADGEVGIETQDALTSSIPSTSFNSGNLLVLQRGDRGDRVLQLQQLLQNLGYPPGSLDGVFGLETEAAVVDFQLLNRLSPTGVVDAQTESTLLGLAPPIQRPFQPLPTGAVGREQNVYAVVVPVRQSLYAGALLQGIRQLRPDAVLVENADRGAYINAGSFNNCDRAEDFAELLQDEGYEASVAYFANREFFAVDGQTPLYSPYGLSSFDRFDRPLVVPASPTSLPRFY
ncbi:peptidoglycan-binding protein [Oscillatoriales cyanobacterium LEGE 11467]|uniref:Peptidoglycan-binding protein n=1 Tax=Zarconia navalis LEGE 11467 TaxID=1828826 RepID=A0A928W1L3_9CYAN|nr:peptidoglycan-binding protein [Zarconia navalis]MBE9041580.1 peptidoglycan-binding protein [Zarconia navalis LEGE 11467]